MDAIDKIFENLDRWRPLPAYQLERRADIFFSIYLREVIEEFTGTPVHDTIIPELPIKRELVWPDLPSYQSVKVDYALFAEDRSAVFLVELKTDAGSRRDQQDEYLARARESGFRKILLGLVEIMRRTKAKQKYYHLMATLAGLGYVTLPDDIETFLYPRPRAGLGKRLEAIEVADDDPPIEIIYVQPVRGDGDRDVVDFETVARIVERHDDRVSRLFAEHLRRWVTPAGAAPQRGA